MKVYLTLDDSRPYWDCICGVFRNKDDALKLAEEIAGSRYEWIEDEERWEGPDCRSVWVDEKEVK